MNEKAALVGNHAAGHLGLHAPPGQVQAEATAEAPVHEHGLQAVQLLVAGRHRVPQAGGGGAVVAGRRYHPASQQVAGRVDQEKVFAAFDALARIVPTRAVLVAAFFTLWLSRTAAVGCTLFFALPSFDGQAPADPCRQPST